jgi:tetratricopeptide (TPR) repeat protein
MLEHHPDRNTLERFSRGQATAPEERWIEDHLRTGCPICQREVDALLAPTLDASLLAQLGLTLPAAGERTAEEALWSRVLQRLEQRMALVTVERGAAPPLLAELLERPASGRTTLVRAERRFQTLAVCELLVEKSFQAGFRDPAEALALAGLGLQVAESLDPEIYGPSVVRDLAARAWAYLGNARRLAFDLAGAEEALGRAEEIAETGSADPLEEARILDFKASLLSDQGRFEQAAELLDIVVDIYGGLKETHRKGRALISKGTVLGHAGWPEDAIRILREGLSLLDWGSEPRLVLMARHNLAWFLTDCGRGEEAGGYLERFRHTYASFQDPWTELRLLWLCGRIAAATGRPEEAGEALREARRRFLAGGQGYEASLVTLELANLYLEERRTADVRQLAREMLPVFLSQDVHREALAALTVFQRAAEADGATPHLVRQISDYLLRARWNPSLRFQPAAA